MMKTSFISALLISVSLTASCKAAKFDYYYNGEGNAVITLEGEIVEGDRERFRDVVKGLNRNNRYVSGLRLNTGGGNLKEGFGIAADVMATKIDTMVYRNSMCASACFLIFAAGNQKWIDDGARIGVHAAADQNGKETVGSMATTLEMVRIMKMLNAPPSVIAKAATTVPGAMAWLTADEAIAMGARWANPKSASASDSYNSPIAPQSSNYINPYASTDSEWRKYWTWVDKTISIQNEDYEGEVGKSNTCGDYKGARVCTQQAFYYDKSGRYSVAIEMTVAGEVGLRMVCRSTYRTDAYRVCTDFVSEKNERQVFRKGRWFTL